MSTAAGEPPVRRYSIAHLLLLVPWVALVLGAWKSIEDNSFLWHVRAGTLQLSQGRVLTEDPFSFTMLGEPWRTQSWLAELGYGWLEGLTGLGFVPFMLLVMSALTLGGLALIAYRKSQNLLVTALLLILSTLGLLSFLVPRPVIFSYLLMVLVVLSWGRPETRWTVPFLIWAWAALHASFVIGLVYIGLVVVMNRQWREIPKCIVAGLVTLATAHGLGVVGFLLDFGAGSEALSSLTEWRRPGLFEPVFLPFLALLVVVVVGAFRDRTHPRHLWLIVPFTLLGMSSVRAIPPAFIALFPLAANALSGLKVGLRSSQSPRATMTLAGAILVVPFLALGGSGLSPVRFPVEATGRLSDVPTFHDDVVGGFLIWAEGPDRLVYVDDRAELYGERLGELVAVRTGESDWRPVFERDGIEQAILANGESLIDRIQDEGGWSVVYEDDSFTILRP